MSEQAIKRLTNLLENFVTETMKEVISTQTLMSDGGLKWKNNITGPALEILNSLIKYYSRMIPNYSYKSRALIKPLKALQKSIDKQIEELGIDGTAIIGIDEIYFPEGIKDEVYIGLLNKNGLRTGQGALTNGEILYKGYWKDDMKNGFGMQVYEDGWVFEGHWDDGVPKNGRWKIGKNKYFYGMIHRNKTLAKIYRIGFSQADKKKYKNEKNVKNIFYWKKQRTNLMNVKINQEFNLKGMEGVSKLQKHKVASIEWIHGLKYTGNWDNFKPRLEGEFSFPKSGYPKLKVLGKPKFMLAIKEIYPDYGEVNAPPGTIYHKINQKSQGRKYEINFKGGIVYDGAVNENFEFEGLGTLTAPKKSNITWIFGKEVKKITGLFIPVHGFVAEFLFDDQDEDYQRDLKLVSNLYFKDRLKIQKFYKSIFDVKYEWIKMRGKGGKIVRYKGGWLNYVINGPCRIQIDDGPEVEGIAQNGMIFNAKINLAYFKELKSNADEKNKVKFKKPVTFKNGNIYIGGYNIEKQKFRGFGKLTLPNGTIKKGYWRNSKLVIDMDYYKIKREEIKKLKEGEYTVNFHNGVKYSGKWDDYKFIEGTVTLADGTEEKFNPSKNYLEIPEAEQYKSKLIFFNWKKFKYEKVKSVRINQKIVLHQQKHLESLIDYGMLKKIKKEDIKAGMEVSVKTNYTKFPLVQKFIDPTLYNFDHLEKDYNDDVISDKTSEDMLDDDANLKELKQAKDFEKMFKNMNGKNDQEAYFSNTDFTLDLEGFEEEQEAQKKEDDEKKKSKKKKVNDEEEDEDDQDKDEDDDDKDSVNDEDDEKEDEEIENEINIEENLKLQEAGKLLNGEGHKEEEKDEDGEGKEEEDDDDDEEVELEAEVKKKSKEKVIKLNTEEKVKKQKEEEDDILNDPSEETRDSTLEITREGLVKTTVDLFSNMSPTEIKAEYHKSLLADPHIRNSMFKKHKLNGIAEVGRNYIKFFNGDKYYFQNNERGYMHSLGTIEKYSYKNWNGVEDTTAPYCKRHYYWSLFFSKIEFTNFQEKFFQKVLRNNITYKKFSNLNAINLKQSDGSHIKATFMDCKLVGFANIKSKEQIKAIKKSKKSLVAVDAEDNENEDEDFWFDDQFYAEVTDPTALENFRKLIKRKPGLGLKYTRRLYNLLKPLDRLYSKWKKSDNMGDESRHFMIDFPDKFEKETYQDFLIKFEGEEYDCFSDIVSNIEDFTEGTYTIFYPNGDKYVGQKNKKLQFCGEGEYKWRAGYIYDGTFNLNIPLGEGTFIDCMGGSVEGFFFKNYILKEGYGLMKMIEIYNKKIKRDTKHDVDIIFDPTVMKKASRYYIGEQIEYGKIFEDVMNSKKTLKKRITIVRDGERNYSYNWDEKILMGIKNMLIQREDDKIFKSSKRRKKKTVYQRVNSKSSINSLENKLKELESMNKSRMQDRYKWITRINLIYITKWQREQLVELVKDKDKTGVGIAFRYFMTKGFMNKFFNLFDEKKRNLLMIAAFYGFRGMFADLLAAMKYCFENNLLNLSQLKKIIKKRDMEGNNIVDLACIRGYNVEEELMVTKKITILKITDSDNTSEKKSFLSKEDKNPAEIPGSVELPVFPQLPNPSLKKPENLGSRKNIPIPKETTTNQVSRRNSLQADSNVRMKNIVKRVENKKEKAQRLDKTSADKNLKRDLDAAKKRDNVNVESFDLEIFQRMYLRLDQDVNDLFKKSIKTNEKLVKTFQEIKGRTSSDITFVTRRAACIKLLFSFCRKYKFGHVLKKKYYDLKMNNPLHYTIHKGDLHTTLILLEEENDIIFWRNEKRDVASQVIKYAGENHAKSLATFASILNEVTRQFNFDVINKLFIEGEGEDATILEKHLKSVGEEENSYNANKWIKNLKLQKFIPENNYLYQNNFILLSDELCYQYVNMLKERSMVAYLKEDYTMFKYHIYGNVTILESLQRNFLDYYKGVIDDYHEKELCEDMRSKMKRLLCWFVFILGEVDIHPEIYDALGIDPFEKILDGRNIFHFMCEYNSKNLLGNFLGYMYERCHSEPFDSTRKTFKQWDKPTLNEEKYEELLKKFSIKTDQNQQTPAHLCAINQSYDCLRILLKHNIDIEEINLRGRTVVEILLNSKRNKEETLNVDSVEAIDYQIYRMIKEDILITCKRHSLINEFVPEADEEQFREIFVKSKYELHGKLKEIRWEVRDRVKKYSEKYKKLLSEQEIIMKSLNMLVQMDQFDSVQRLKKLADFRREYISLSAKSKKKLSKSKMIENEKRIKELEYLISNMAIKKLVIIPKERIMMELFTQNFLKKVKHFKYKEIEKFIKMELHKKILQHNFGKPVPSEFKYVTPRLGLFCIQVLIEPGKTIENNVVVKQIFNIKSKYRRFGGGIKIEMIKGFPVRVRNKKKLYLCKKTYESWFVIITVSNDLLMKFAYDEQMGAYNMRDRYHTVFSKGSIDEEDLEPLKHYQKIQILMRLIKSEFDISGTINRNLAVKYFPLHDYRMMKLLMTSWSENKFLIHFKDIFNQTHQNIMKVYSLVSIYHGIQQGFYFGFLASYTNSLFWLALFGMVSLAIRMIDSTRTLEEGQVRYFQYVTTLAPFVTGIWSTTFMIGWRKREIELSYSFDVYEEENVKQVRDKYRGQSTINENTMRITKKATSRTFLALFFNIASFTVGTSLVLLIYFVLKSYNDQIDDDPTYPEQTKTLLLSAIGAANGTLNFILSVIYEKIVDYLVYSENHIYRKQYLDSMIMKKVVFKLISTNFTLIAQTLIERKSSTFVSIQVTSNLLTSVALNYGISVLIPVYHYINRRYYFWSYVLTCGCCCKSRKKKGKLEDFKDEIILRMLSNQDTKDTFKRYCMDGEIDEDLLERVEDYKKIKEIEKNRLENLKKQIEENKKNNLKKKLAKEKGKVFPKKELAQEESARLLKKDTNTSENRTKKKEERLQRIFQSTVKNIESVSEETYSFNPGPNSDLGINKHNNIKLRLRENFTKYVLGKEKIIETSYMLNLESLEEGFYSSLLMQYSFICFFSPFLMSAGLISWVINLFIIFLTILVYTGSTTRPISRRIKDIGIWNNIFNLVGYLGIVYNSIVIVRYSQGASLFFDFGSSEGETEAIYIVQGGILVFKFLLSISTQSLPNWINDSMIREKMEKQRAIELNAKVLNRLYKEAARKNKALNENGTIDPSFYSGQEAADLRYFFENDKKIVNRSKFEFNESEVQEKNAPNIYVTHVEVDD